MIEVSVTTDIIDPQSFYGLAHRVQSRFRFGSGNPSPNSRSTKSRRDGPIDLYITDAPSKALFFTRLDRGVAVSLWQSQGISLYTGIDVDSYLLLCSILGLTQWRALSLNPLLREEDFIHEWPSECIFAKPESKAEFALLLENPVLCQGCTDFYHCLGVDLELQALCKMLDHVCAQTARGPFSRNVSKVL